VLRLTASGMSSRKVAASLSVGGTTIIDCLQRARAAGVSWPLREDITDELLEARLYPASASLAELAARRPRPDWATIHRELKRPGVTLQLLWEEHRSAHPDGYGYSRFCELYRAWERRLSPTMRQTHVAGERMFVDYAGTTLTVMDGTTGEVLTAQLFVAVLGACNYTYAEATWTQGLADWIGSHTRTFAFFGGVTSQIVSDNLKSGITKACFYEPAVNRTYAEMAAHYDTAVVPARPYKPRDKAKVEVAVLVATRWIIAKLRNRRFFSLAELNAAIAELLTALNDRVTRHLGASRRALFEEVERPALKPLPAEPYTYAQWKECKLGLDYHVEVEKHYYSVPHQLLREKMWVRIGTGSGTLCCLPGCRCSRTRGSSSRTQRRDSRASLGDCQGREHQSDGRASDRRNLNHRHRRHRLPSAFLACLCFGAACLRGGGVCSTLLRMREKRCSAPGSSSISGSLFSSAWPSNAYPKAKARC